MKRVALSLLTVLLFNSVLIGQTDVMYVKPEQENVRATPGGQKLGEIVSGRPDRPEST